MGMWHVKFDPNADLEAIVYKSRKTTASSGTGVKTGSFESQESIMRHLQSST